jgi:hypothetical protein
MLYSVRDHRSADGLDDRGEAVECLDTEVGHRPAGDLGVEHHAFLLGQFGQGTV